MKNQINNLLYTYNNIKHNMPNTFAYESSNSLFDVLIEDIKPLSIINLAIIDKITNILYSGIMINNILGFSQNITRYKKYFTNTILFYHHPLHANLKREDTLILSQALKKYRKIAFCPDYVSSGLGEMVYIPYGLPRIDESKLLQERKQIVVLNLNHNKQADIIYQYMRNKFEEVDVIHNIDSLQEATDILTQYKVCVDLDHYYNVLLAGVCGCLSLTPLKSYHDHITQIKESNDIFRLAPNMLDTFDKEARAAYSRSLSEHHDMGRFQEGLMSALTNISQESLVL